MSKTRGVVFHPVGFTLYPVLAMVAHNLGQVKPGIGLRALIISLVGTLLLWLILQLMLRDWQRSGLLCSGMVLLFFSYGHIYQGLNSAEILGATLGRHRFLAPIWLALFVFLVWLVLKHSDAVKKLTQPLNLISVVVLLFPVAQIMLFQLRPALSDNRLTLVDSELVESGLQPSSSEALPDVYYFILDAYTNEATLSEIFDFDNEPFLSQLEARGFIVASCSQSNYAQTELSFASSLNLSYLDELNLNLSEGSESREELWPLIRNSGVRQLLEDLGYQTVAFETGYYWSELEDADLYLKPPEISDSGIHLPAGLNAFEATLLRSTFAWMIIDQVPWLPKFLVRDLDRSAEEHYQRLTFNLDELEGMASVPGPKFVFAHIVSPHSPFVFGPEGEFVDHPTGDGPMDLEVYRQGYVLQIQVLNQRLLEIVDRLIEGSATPPVIIIQGDHGPEEGSSQDRMSVLNAYYLQGQPNPFVDEGTTPVNSFRIVFNTIFGTQMPLLEDVSYFSTYEAPYDFRIIPPSCDNPAEQ